MRSRIHLAFVVSLVAPALTSAQIPARAATLPPPPRRPSGPPLGFDSLDVRRLLADAVSAARAAPVSERASLLAAVGRVQVESGDFSGAEQTIGLFDVAAPPDVQRQLGQPEWFAMLDRASLARQLVCGLRTAGRADDALAVVRRMPPSEEREWLLAHVASLTARSGKSDQWREALGIAREVHLSEARLDALLGVMEAVPDTGAGFAVLREAYGDARNVQLADVDRRNARNAMLAGQALRVGRVSDATEIFDRLSNYEDLWYVMSVASRRGDAALAARLAPTVLEAGNTIIDSAARASFLNGVTAMLNPPRRSNRSEKRRNPIDSVKAASTWPEDLAQRAAGHDDWSEVHRQVERIPIGATGARRAQLWSNLAWELQGTQLDTARVYLRLGRASLRRSGTLTPEDSAAYDDAAESIASRQFSVADDSGAIETLNLIRDPQTAHGAFFHLGGSSFGSTSPNALQAYAARLRDRRVRDAMLARIVDRYASERLPWAVALADSIATPQFRVAAQMSLVRAFRQKGDTVQAHRTLTQLVSTNAADVLADRHSPIGDLVAIGEWREADAWAHRADAPADRARRLIAVAASLNDQIQIQLRGPYYRMRGGNGPDACLDEF